MSEPRKRPFGRVRLVYEETPFGGIAHTDPADSYGLGPSHPAPELPAYRYPCGCQVKGLVKTRLCDSFPDCGFGTGKDAPVNDTEGGLTD